jgi:hypothetical protein
MLLFSSGVFVFAAAALIIYSNTGLHLDAVAGSGMLGEKIISSPQTTLNDFTVLTSNVKAGSTQINVADNTINSHGRFAGDLKAGELVMIVQMQSGAKTYVDINEEKGEVDEAGKYEFAEVAGIEEGPKINFTAALKNSYAVNCKTQVVRVPRYHELNIEKGATLATDAWDGSKGGIVAIEINGNALINGTVDASGKGFNGTSFQKLLKNAVAARKISVASDTCGSRIYFGQASINKTLNTQYDGGGIVFLIVNGTISGTGSIHADGSNVMLPGADPFSSGGQGGSVYICSRQTEGEITVTANGGNAWQEIDSTVLTTMRGRGGDGGIIRTGDISSFRCFAEGGLNASAITYVNGVESRDSAKAISGIISSSIISPYSRNPISPTKLEYFAAIASNDNVKVSWVTASEENVDYYTVERSVDGGNFIPVFKVNGKGTSGERSVYSFDDVDQTAADCQYRLTQTTIDNRVETFPPVKIKQAVKTSETKLISVQPNPIGDHFTIQCLVSEPGLIDISLTDISGNVIRKESAVAGEGMNTIPVNNLADIPKGTYFLSMSTETQKMSTLKIVK